MALLSLCLCPEPLITSLIFSHDPVPRLSPVAVQKLRAELCEVDWAAQLRSSLLEAEYTQVGGCSTQLQAALELPHQPL